jgi:hypothetical protein
MIKFVSDLQQVGGFLHVLYTTLCDKVCRWFSPVFSTNKTDRHDITEMLLKVALNTINQTKSKPSFGLVIHIW